MAKTFGLVPSDLSITNGDSIRLNAGGSAFESYTPASALWYTAENVANKVTSISWASTDTQYGSAKLLYDQLALKALERTYLSAWARVFPTITDNWDGSVTIGNTGVFWIYPNADATGWVQAVSVNWGTFTLTDNAKNFIYIYWNWGSPVMGASIDTNIDWPKDYVIPFTIFRTGTVLHTIPWGLEGLALAEKMNEKEITLRKFTKDTGLALSEIATRIISVSTGYVYAGINYLTVAASRSDVNITYLYTRTAWVWSWASITQYNNSQYDDLTNIKSLALEWPNASTWTRSGTTATVTLAWHNLTNWDTINVTVTSASAAIPLWAYTIAVTWTDTFTFTCNNSWATSGTLTYTTALRYAVNWIYRGVETQNHTYVVLWNWNYNLAQAQACVPDWLPAIIPAHAILVWRIIVARNGSVATEINQTTNVFLQSSSVSNHQDLLNILQAGAWVIPWHISDQAQTIAWAKTFSDTIVWSISWNAATVTTNANLSGHVTSVGNTTSLGSFTVAQLNTAISDADVATGWW